MIVINHFRSNSIGCVGGQQRMTMSKQYKLITNDNNNNNSNNNNSKLLSNDHKLQTQSNADYIDSHHLLVTGTVLNSLWKVTDMLDEGGFGQIYQAEHCMSGYKVAIKAESLNAKHPQLKAESELLRKLRFCRHFVSWMAAGYTADAFYLIMELCGPNLHQLKKATAENRFELVTGLWLAIQTIQAVKCLHEAGWVHRDVKPANFCIGRRNGTRRSVFLIDFGMAKSFVDRNGNVQQRRKNGGFHGTVRYVSMTVHQHQDTGRVDDLWSLFYMTVENLLGRLPWCHLNEKQQVKIVKESTDFFLKDRQDRLPRSVEQMHRRLDRYDFYSRPEYESIVAEFDRDLKTMLNETELYLDWEKTRTE